MDTSKGMVLALTLVLLAGSFGCGRFRRTDAGDMPPAHLDPDWRGSPDFRVGEDALDERFAFAETLDLQFEDILFGFDSSQVAAGERAKIEQVAAYLQRNPNVKIIVEGHTCDIGNREYNMALGERRALAARAYLVQLGIEPARVQTLSYGQENPRHFGASEAERRLNRRVAFRLVR